MSDHTPEPWRLEGPWRNTIYANEAPCIYGANDEEVCRVWKREDFRRILACVHACKGIPTERLKLVAEAEDDCIRLSALSLSAIAAGSDACAAMLERKLHDKEQNNE